MNKNIFDVFYNVLIKEASVGRVDCYFIYNIRFDTKILEDNVEIIGNDNIDNLLVPTLIIKNKQEFNELLNRYVSLALDFYDELSYCDEICSSNYKDNDLGVSKEKLIMTLLWGNATAEDFNDPCNYLRRRIAFFELGNLEKYVLEKNISYSDILGYDVEFKITKNGLENETPYSFKTFLVNHESGSRVYEFPSIYFGIYNNNLYVYAIQNNRYRLINEFYTKKINRLLYKVNEGFDTKEDTYENYGVGNLKDITPNFLIVSNILMGILKNNDIRKVIVSPMLIARWNAKMIMLGNKKKKLLNDKLELDKVNEIINKYNEEYLYLQSNMTEKFLRIFRRLVYHHSSMVIGSYPFELGTDLEVNILDNDDFCNNKLLEDTFNLNFSKKDVVKKK